MAIRHWVAAGVGILPAGCDGAVVRAVVVQGRMRKKRRVAEGGDDLDDFDAAGVVGYA